MCAGARMQEASPVLRRFVTKAELEKLGIGHLVGTRLLRAYMHGFFLHNRLWNKARAIAEPFMYDSYRKERVTEKLEAERKSRIGLKRKLPKVRSVPLPQDRPCPCKLALGLVRLLYIHPSRFFTCMARAL